MAKKILISLIILLVSAVALGACGSNQPVEPTIDANQLYTMAAQTVVVQLTEAALKQPTVTPPPPNTPTAAPIPTIAIPPTTPPLEAETQPVVNGGSPQPGDTGGPTEKPLPTEKPPVVENTKPATINGDHAYFGYQHPADNSTFNPGDKFMLVFGIVNNGTTTWSTAYRWEFLGGTQLSGVSSVALKTAVAPGAKSEVDIAARAPSDKGKFICRWRLVTSTGVPVPGGEVYISLKVE